eukprot:gene1569-22392_t
MPAVDEGRVLLIDGLSPDATAASVRDAVKIVFNTDVEVVDVRMLRDDAAICAYVTWESPEYAEEYVNPYEATFHALGGRPREFFAPGGQAAELRAPRFGPPYARFPPTAINACMVAVCGARPDATRSVIVIDGLSRDINLSA